VTWRALEKPWNDVSVEYCEVCGSLLIQRYWEFTRSEGEVVRACSEECEALAERLRRARQAEGGPGVRTD
jgi:hypothetical protein